MNTLLNRNPLPWAALISFLMSFGLAYHHIINLDGILYLQVAKAFTQHEYAQGLALYGWPFYSLLIAGLSMVSSLSLELSAILINACFMALMAAGFVTLVRELGGSKQVQWVAALIFLLHPAINGYRELIIRDFGAWAFLFWSLVYLSRYSQEQRWKWVIGWTVTAGMTFLFRPENIAWLALGPLVLFTLKHNLKSVLKAYSIFIILGVTLCLGILLFKINVPITKLSQFAGVTEHLFVTGLDQFSLRAEALRSVMSPELKFHHSATILAFALVSYLIFLLIKLLSPLYSILVGYAAVRRPLITAPQKRILFWLLFLYAGMYLGFISKNYFISSRYLVPFVSVLMVWVPFALADAWPRASKALKIIIALILTYMLLDGIVHMGYSKEYLRESGKWINQHTPVDATLYTDSKQVAYYADRPLVEDPNQADIIAIYYTRKSPDAHVLIESLSKYKQMDFHNKREDGVRVILSPSSSETRGS